MNTAYQRAFVSELYQSVLKKDKFIHVLIGPRQVGKTTGVQQLMSKWDNTVHYASADGEILKPSDWFVEQWAIAKNKSPTCLLIIDEIQKIENWSEVVKKFWDDQARSKQKLRLILLGSSSLMLHRGLSESLTGRFFLHKVYHWSLEESENAYGLSLEQFLKYGGYPASYEFIENRIDWLNYIQNSIIDTVIGKDILSLNKVKSPALFRQCFSLACSYSAQEISYSKLLGQLQNKGNTDLVKHYLELFEQAFLLKQLFKFSAKKVSTRSSSPKILPACPALYSVTLDADLNSSHFGRVFEVMVGNYLMQLPGELFYWRENNLEVDYIIKFGQRLWAIEVKWNNKVKTRGILEFSKLYPKASIALINPENYRDVLSKISEELHSDL